MTMGCGQHGGVGVAFYGVVCWPGVKTCPIFLKALKIGPTKREQKESRELNLTIGYWGFFLVV